MSVSSKMHYLLDKAPLLAESKEDDDKKVIVKTLLAAFKKGGYDEMMTAAYTLEGHGISKQMLSSLLLGMTRTGELGGVSVRLTVDEKWLIDQYAYDIRESKGFHHGTVRQWQNGRHMKNGTGWERIKTGRSQGHASKMPTIFDVVQGNVSPEALGPPIASMPSIGVVGASVPEMSVSEATLILQAQLEGEESFDEDIMKMVFGVLRKVTGRKKPMTTKAVTPSNVTPVNVYQQFRKSNRTRMAER